MNGWIVVSPSQANSVEALCVAKAKEKGLRCSKWAEPVPHPTDASLVAYRIKPLVYEALPKPFKDEVKTLAELKAMGFFPVVRPDGSRPMMSSGYGGEGETSIAPIEKPNWLKRLVWAAAGAGAGYLAYEFFRGTNELSSIASFAFGLC